VSVGRAMRRADHSAEPARASVSNEGRHAYGWNQRRVPHRPGSPFMVERLYPLTQSFGPVATSAHRVESSSSTAPSRSPASSGLQHRRAAVASDEPVSGAGTFWIAADVPPRCEGLLVRVFSLVRGYLSRPAQTAQSPVSPRVGPRQVRTSGNTVGGSRDY